MIGMDRTTGRALSGMDHLVQSVGDIVSTAIGTRLCARDYGSDVPDLIDQPANAITVLRIYAATALAIAREERRIRLTGIRLRMGDGPEQAAICLTGTTVDAMRRPVPVSITVPVRRETAASQ